MKKIAVFLVILLMSFPAFAGLKAISTAAPISNTSVTTNGFTINSPTVGPGTVSNGAGGTTVTGVGTTFTKTFVVNDYITIPTAGGNAVTTQQTVQISAVTDDTNMTVAAITNANTAVAYDAVAINAIGQTFSTPLYIQGQFANFLQGSIVNTSTAPCAQAGWNAATGPTNNLTGFAFLGMNGASFNCASAFNVGHGGDINFGGVSTGHDLYVWNGDANGNLYFTTGGTADANRRVKIDKSGNVSLQTPLAVASGGTGNATGDISALPVTPTGSGTSCKLGDCLAPLGGATTPSTAYAVLNPAVINNTISFSSAGAYLSSTYLSPQFSRSQAASATSASAASFFNNKGAVTTASNDTPRFDYLPIGPSNYIYNQNATTMNHWKAALAAVKSNQSSAQVLTVGDSITAGYLSSGASGANEQRTQAYPSHMANVLNYIGIPSRGDAFMGESATNYTSAVDTIITAYAGGWTTPTGAGFFSLGGNPFYNSGASGNFTTAPLYTFDGVRIYYVSTPSSGVMGVSIDGGAVQNVTTTGTAGINYVDVSAGSVGTHTVNLTWVSGGALYVVGERFKTSSQAQVNIANAGWTGATSANLSSVANAYAPLNAVAAYCPDLLVLEGWINDYNAPISVSAFTANMGAIISAQLACGGSAVYLINSNYGNSTNLGYPYVKAIYALADTYNIPVIDMGVKWGGTGYAAGLMNSDYTHPNASGYLDMATEVANTISGAYNVATNASVGLLYEPARTNLIRNPIMTGAVANISLPTNWSVQNTAGLTTTVVGTGTENGMPYVDVRINGTSTGTSYGIYFDQNLGTRAQNEVLGAGVFLKMVGGTSANISQYAMGIFETPSFSFSSFGQVSFIDQQMRRLTGTVTLSQANTTGARAVLYVLLASTAATDVTFRVYDPQFEIIPNTSASVSSPIIPPTAASWTRAADSLSFTLPSNVGSIKVVSDDGSAQVLSGLSSGLYTLSAAALTRPHIASLVANENTVAGSLYVTNSLCSSAASPAVCASAPAGFSKVAAAGTSIVVNTTAVTSASQIFLNYDDSQTGCTIPANPTLLLPPYVSSRVAGTSFTVTMPVAPTTNAQCIDWHIIN